MKIIINLLVLGSKSHLEELIGLNQILYHIGSSMKLHFLQNLLFLYPTLLILEKTSFIRLIAFACKNRCHKTKGIFIAIKINQFILFVLDNF